MATDSDIRAGTEILDDVERQFEEFSRTKKASIAGPPYFGDRTAFSQALTKDCDRAEETFGDYRAGLARSNFLKGKIWQGHPDRLDIQYMEKALELGFDEFMVRLRLAIKEEERGSKTKAIQHYKRIAEIKGPTSPEGAKALSEARRLEGAVGPSSAADTEKSSGGCFVVTAASGDARSYEVTYLSAFRDDVLSESRMGRTLVSAYYMISPPLSKVVARFAVLRKLTLLFLIRPVIRILRVMRQASAHQCG